MINPFVKKRARIKLANEASALVSYQAGDLFDPGFQRMAYVPETTLNPLFTVKGAGEFAGQMQSTQPPQVYQLYTVPTNPLWGYVVGEMALQGLDEPSGDNGSVSSDTFV